MSYSYFIRVPQQDSLPLLHEINVLKGAFSSVDFGHLQALSVQEPVVNPQSRCSEVNVFASALIATLRVHLRPRS